MHTLFCCLLSLLLLQDQQQDPVFSGPQVGEQVVPFAMIAAVGDQAGKEIDVVGQADGGPLLIIFVHERTRLAFGLSNALAKYAASEKDRGLKCGVCYLTSDSSEARQWMNRIEQYFTKEVSMGVSKEGIEGPGAYGLNRNVALTILAVDKNKVEANFAIVDPSLHADGQKVIDAVSKLTGATPVPKIATFAPRRTQPAQAKPQTSPQLERLLRRVVNKQATPERVEQAAKQLVEYLAEHPREKARVGQICRNIIEAGKLDDYGTESAREYIKQWSMEYGPDMKDRRKR